MNREEATAILDVPSLDSLFSGVTVYFMIDAELPDYREFPPRSDVGIGGGWPAAKTCLRQRSNGFKGAPHLMSCGRLICSRKVTVASCSDLTRALGMPRPWATTGTNRKRGIIGSHLWAMSAPP